MIFVWDAAKNRINQRRHGVSFEAASRVFVDLEAVSYIERFVEAEERWHTIGMAGGIAILLVVHTIKEENEEETVRIISARKATPRERALYESYQRSGTSGA